MFTYQIKVLNLGRIYYFKYNTNKCIDEKF